MTSQVVRSAGSVKGQFSQVGPRPTYGKLYFKFKYKFKTTKPIDLQFGKGD